MKTIIVAAAALAGLTAAPALANPAATVATAAPAATKATPDPDRRYCFKDTFTGSRIERKDCKTRAQWVARGVDMSAFDR